MWSNPSDVIQMLRTELYFTVCGESGIGVQTATTTMQINMCIHSSRMNNPKMLASHLSACFEDAIGF
jgi:hypothetical protein